MTAPPTGTIRRAMKKRAPENVRGGPADGAWQEPPQETTGLMPAWTIEAMTPYFVHLYLFDVDARVWAYAGMALEAQLGAWDPEAEE